MELNAIKIDPAMVHAILSAFSVAEHEAMSSLIPESKAIDKQPESREYARAEFRVLEALHSNYQEIVNQYFDITKQMEYKRTR